MYRYFWIAGVIVTPAAFGQSFVPLGAGVIPTGVSQNGQWTIAASLTSGDYTALRFTAAGASNVVPGLPYTNPFIHNPSLGELPDGTAATSVLPVGISNTGAVATTNFYPPRSAQGTYIHSLNGLVSPSGTTMALPDPRGDVQPGDFAYAQPLGLLGLSPDGQHFLAQSVRVGPPHTSVVSITAPSYDASPFVGSVSFNVVASRDFGFIAGRISLGAIVVQTPENGVIYSLAANSLARVSGVSLDGQTVVGQQNGRAVRWTNGVLDLDFGTLPDDPFARTFGLSDDGRVVLTQSYGAFFEPYQGEYRRIGIWLADANRTLSLEGTLLEMGANLDGWLLTDPVAISGDGNTVVGWGLHNGVREGFIANIPAPSSAALLLVAIPSFRRRR